MRTRSALYPYVLNEIRAAHYSGAVKGPAAVLRSGEGNDADQAALLAALLRTAGFPARVVWGGVQEIRLEALLEHYGAADTADLERTLLAAGAAWEPVFVGGRAAAYRIERAWCEVWLPFANFRGVVLDASGPTWLALDPSLKCLAPPTSEPLLDRMAFDAAGFVADYLAGDRCTAPLTEALACPAPRDLLRAEADAFLAAEGESYDQLAVPPAILPQSEEVLPTAMVGTVVEVHGFGYDYTEDPAAPPAAGRPRRGGDPARRRAAGGRSRRARGYVVVRARHRGRRAGGGGLPRRAVAGAAVPDQRRPRPARRRCRDRPWRGRHGMGRPFELEVVLSAPGGASVRFANALLAGVPVGLGLGPGPQGYATPRPQPASTPQVLAQLAKD